MGNGRGIQRVNSIAGLSNVERAFVHVDYDDDHDIYEEHKKLYKPESESRTFKDTILGRRRSQGRQTPTDGQIDGQTDEQSRSV